MVGRLNPGVTATQAQQDAERVAQEIMRGYPSFMASLHISSVVRPLQEETIEQARPLVRTLFFAVAIVLLIACANLAGLLLVRAIRRQRAVAVRMALGARSSALLRQAILESLILSVLWRPAWHCSCRSGAARGQESAAGKFAARQRNRPELDCGRLCACCSRSSPALSAGLLRPLRRCARA